MFDMVEVNKVCVKLKNFRIICVWSLDLILEELDLYKYVFLFIFLLFFEIGVMFKCFLDCYYFKKGSVKNVVLGVFKFGKYGVLDV